MARPRSKERCYCKEEDVYCKLANTNPTCIHYTGLRQCGKNCKNSYDWQNLKECHPSPSCGFMCCYRQHITNVGKSHCTVVTENRRELWNE